MTETMELKPCPFCGSEAILNRKGNDYTRSQTAIIKCTKSACFAEQRVAVIKYPYDWAVQKVIEKWNTRAQPSAPADVVEKMAAALRKGVDLLEPFQNTGDLGERALNLHREALAAYEASLQPTEKG